MIYKALFRTDPIPVKNPLALIDVFSREHGLGTLPRLRKSLTLNELAEKIREKLFKFSEETCWDRHKTISARNRSCQYLKFLEAIYKKFGIKKKFFDRYVFMKKNLDPLGLSDTGNGLDDELFAMESSVILEWMPSDWRPGDPV